MAGLVRRASTTAAIATHDRAARGRAGRRSCGCRTTTWLRARARRPDAERGDAQGSCRSRAGCSRSRSSAAGSSAPRAATTPSSSARPPGGGAGPARDVGLAGRTAPAAGQGDPAVEAETPAQGRPADELRGPVRALGAPELEGARDRLLASTSSTGSRPRDRQLDTMWSLSSFYIGEERVAADLAPFVLAAPSGEIEIFLATQLVDEARHAAFFDRFMAEVMALEAEDIRGRLARDGGDDAPARGAPCSTISCAGSRSRSRRSPTTSTCSSRAS